MYSLQEMRSIIEQSTRNRGLVLVSFGSLGDLPMPATMRRAYIDAFHAFPDIIFVVKRSPSDPFYAEFNHLPTNTTRFARIRGKRLTPGRLSKSAIHPANNIHVTNWIQQKPLLGFFFLNLLQRL